MKRTPKANRLQRLKALRLASILVLSCLLLCLNAAQAGWLTAEGVWSDTEGTVSIYQSSYNSYPGYSMPGTTVSETFMNGLTMFCDAEWNPDALELLTDQMVPGVYHYEYEFDPANGTLHGVTDGGGPGLIAQFPFKVLSNDVYWGLNIHVFNQFMVMVSETHPIYGPGQSWSASSGGSVTYLSPDVPEPATLSLLALGGTGLMILRKRSSSR